MYSRNPILLKPYRAAIKPRVCVSGLIAAGKAAAVDSSPATPLPGCPARHKHLLSMMMSLRVLATASLAITWRPVLCYVPIREASEYD
ncbi:hypothetical protein E2C01_089832 [Portunus trituberculatus]|uniref:Uncharacterized protein n=1 Tax=Portunus trituberculatus TaxID=210409 RepID=A0A5B7JQP4_PORTR|nr:hypothetical protein [Portunus trituberculatus]